MMKHSDRYTCEDLFRKLDDYLDRVLSPGEMARLQEHLERCASCATEYRFEEDLMTALRGKLQRISPALESSDLMQRISGLLDHEEAGESGGES